MTDIKLSSITVQRRLDDLETYIIRNLKEKLNTYLYLLLNRSDNSQLLIFIRFIENNFEINEEYLDCVSMQTTRRINIFNAVQHILEKYISITKLTAVCSDGAPAMRSKNVGFVGHILYTI